MRIAIIGATGMAGSRIRDEALRRKHVVTGIARSRSDEEQNISGYCRIVADATDLEDMERLAQGHDVLVLATRPSPGSEVDVETPVVTVLTAALTAGRRVLVIGGAGPLRSPDHPARRVVDDERYVPRQWRAIAQASVDQLRACSTHLAAWTYLSPPALFGPGVRTGGYRRGEDRLLVDVQGVSHISAEDLAIAALDEIEQPHPRVRHFTVASRCAGFGSGPG